MKKIFFLFCLLPLLSFFALSQIYVTVPSVQEGGVFQSERDIVPCAPLALTFNINNLKAKGVNNFYITLSLFLDGKDEDGNDYSQPASLGSYLADSNNPINLAVCSQSNLNYIGQNDVQITSWKSLDSNIRIDFKNVQEWEGDDASITLFIGGGNYPDCNYSNFPSNVFQDSTILSILSFEEYGFDMDYPVDLSIVFTPSDPNIEITQEVKIYTFDSHIDWNINSSESLVISRGFNNLLSVDLGDLGIDKKSFSMSDSGWYTKDFVSIDSDRKKLNIFFGESAYYDMFKSMDLPYTPTTISSGDVDGDCKNELLIGGEDGSLNVYDLSSLNFSKYGIILEPEFEIMLAGNAIDSTLADVNQDGNYDYIYIDSDNNQIHILFGTDFSSSVDYNLDGLPRKLVSGDFNGDGLKDICIAKVSGNNVAVLYNNGDGSFDLEEKSMVNSIPLDNVDRGDFDRDGVDDVAFTSSDNDGIVVAKGSSEGLKYKDFIGLTCSPSAVSVENFDGKNGDDVLVGFSDFKELLLCTSDMNGDVSPSYSINTIEDVSVDPNGDTVLPEDGIVNVVMGLSYGGVNDRSGIVGIAKNNFNAIFFPDYKDISFSIINPVYDSKLTANFELYDRVGNILSYRNLSIDEGSQFARYFTSDELFGDGWGNAYVRTFITNPQVYGMYLFNTPSNPQYMDGGKNLSAYDVKGELYFPFIEVEGAEKTTIYVTNPFKDQQKVIFSLYGGNGVLKSKREFLFNSREEKVFDVTTLFSNCTNNDYIKVFSDKGVLAVEAYGDFSTNLACVEGLNQNWDTMNIFSPHVTWGEFGSVNYYSKLSLINISDKSADLIFDLYDDDGNLVKRIEGKHIAPHAKLLFDMKSFFEIEGTVTGYLEILTPQYIEGFRMLGAITFGDADGGKFMATLPLSTEPGNFITGHIANGEIGGVNYFTGIAILSPYADSDVKIECYNQSGIKVEEKTVHINRGARYVRLFSEIFPDLGDMFGGYVKIMADDNWKLFVFQLFGDNDLNFLSAVPAVRIVNNE